MSTAPAERRFIFFPLSFLVGSHALSGGERLFESAHRSSGSSRPTCSRIASAGTPNGDSDCAPASAGATPAPATARLSCPPQLTPSRNSRSASTKARNVDRLGSLEGEKAGEARKCRPAGVVGEGRVKTRATCGCALEPLGDRQRTRSYGGGRRRGRVRSPRRSSHASKGESLAPR